MDEVPIAGRDQANQIFKRFLAQYDVPAYVRRAQQVQDAYEQLLARCRKQRDTWLATVRMRLGILYALAGSWDKAGACLPGEEQVNDLRRLHAQLAPKLRVPVGPTASVRVLRRTALELKESVERFNRRWEIYLNGVDLSHVNALRERYNQYYVLEKECAMRSARLARQGFVRLPPVTLAELSALLPALPVPCLRGSA